MKLTKNIIATASLITAFSTATLAADDDAKFHGAYAGIEGGIDWTKLSATGSKDKSFYYGGIIGFRNQMANGLVVGIEGTLGDSGYKNDFIGIEGGMDWSAGLTLGTAFGSDGANLIYAKAAYVETKFSNETLDTSYRDGGWRFGGGYERAINSNVSFRLGTDYTTYGNDADGWAGKAALLFKF